MGMMTNAPSTTTRTEPLVLREGDGFRVYEPEIVPDADERGPFWSVMQLCADWNEFRWEPFYVTHARCCRKLATAEAIAQGLR